MKLLRVVRLHLHEGFRPTTFRRLLKFEFRTYLRFRRQHNFSMYEFNQGTWGGLYEPLFSFSSRVLAPRIAMAGPVCLQSGLYEPGDEGCTNPASSTASTSFR